MAWSGHTCSIVLWCTVEPLSKGQFGMTLFVLCREVVFERFKCIRTIGRKCFVTSSHVLCREVYCTVSIFGRVHYQNHCLEVCVYLPVLSILCTVHAYVCTHIISSHWQSLFIFFSPFRGADLLEQAMRADNTKAKRRLAYHNLVRFIQRTDMLLI